MEHAIRWHIKVNLEKDPTLYSRFKDRLETILNSYKENWEEIVKQLEGLREEMKVERKKDEPFFDLINTYLYNPTETEIEYCRVLTEKTLSIIKDSATIKNFWDKPSEIRTMEGKLQEEINFSNLLILKDRAAELSSELMKLAKNRMDKLN